jgi:hypothetical protein
MSQETVSKPRSRSPVQTRRFRVGALIVLALAVGLVLWLVLRDTGGSTTSSNTTAVSVGQIKNLAASVGHPVFWVGPRDGYTYELTRQSNGTIIIRYLPQGAKVGDNKPHVSVATYPFPGAFPAVENAAKQSGSASFKIPGNGRAVFARRYPQSIHVAYPGSSYQVEVYDPTRGSAAAMLKSGQLTALGSRTGGSGGPAAKPISASLRDLRSLARSLGHPIYWVGPRRGSTYELLRTSSGKVILRYLPQGVKVGTQKPYLSVATYPFPGAFKAIKALAKQRTQVAIRLRGGGLGVFDRTYPKSIHLAYPGSEYQIEVFDPSPARVRNLVSSGRVIAIG